MIGAGSTLFCATLSQEALLPGSTLLGVVLSLDKTNISIMIGNCVAHLVLISLANIDAHIRSQTSLHAYLLLTLPPVAKFIHKITHVHSLLQDCLFHQALNIVLSPLKVAVKVVIMMSGDPVGNLHYCFTLIASWIADMPEESLLSAMGPKTLPVTTATSKDFGDPYWHPPRTAMRTHLVICSACSKCLLKDYFLKVIKLLGLNGVTNPVWLGWALSDPCDFLTIEPLHHFFQFSWDHNVKWCIFALGAKELYFHFSLIQTPISYQAFNEGISKLKQVTGCDHCAVQYYITGIVAGGAPQNFLITICALLDFHYLAQAPIFTAHSVDCVAQALQEFHERKDAIICLGTHNNWEIPKLKLLQSVVPEIRRSGAPMQWLADITEHVHVDEIGVSAHAGNNQNYYNQIIHHLNRLDKCFRFDLAMYIEEQCHIHKYDG